MASAVLATIGAMRASERSIRSAGPAALIAATGCPVWSRTAAPQQAAASLNSRRSLDQPRRCTSASSAVSRSRLVMVRGVYAVSVMRRRMARRSPSGSAAR